MAGWWTYESDDEPLNLNLFARKSFGFHGISEEKKNTLRNIVQQIGATCDSYPKYVFTSSEYYNSLIEYNSPLYNITYIRDCVDANRCLNIEQYRFGSKYAEKKDFREFEPCCENFHNDQDACIICDPKYKPEVIKPKRKSKQKPSQPDKDKNTASNKKVIIEDVCLIDNCHVSSDPHPKHPKRNTLWEPWESRLILDYIICNKLFICIKSPSLYKRMISEGFLTHRTPESMRLHFRNNVLKVIESFDLPKPILRKLKRIRNVIFPTRTIGKKVPLTKAKPNLNKQIQNNRLKKSNKK